MRIGNNLFGGSFFTPRNVKTTTDYHGIFKHGASSFRGAILILWN